MKNSSEQVWLTTALTEADVPNALTLCFSLRKVLTSRKLAVVVSPKVPKVLREALHYGFDFVFLLEEDRNTAKLQNEDFAKLFVLTLKSFNNILVLSPKILVVKNCDELFDKGKNEKFPITFIMNENEETSCILQVTPSLSVFNRLMTVVPTRNGFGLDTFLKKCQGNEHQAPIIKFLHGPQYSQNGFFLEQEKNISIVNLKGIDQLTENQCGFLGKKILELCQRIHNEDVLPILTALKNSSLPPPNELESQVTNDAISIVGMSCRYPSSNNLDEFWQILLDGKDATGNPPEFRWLREQCSINKPEYRSTNAGFLKCPVDDFDAKFFNLSPKEMIAMDPQHRLLHELVWEGLEDAAIDPSSLEGSNGGVFIGSWLNEYKEILRHGGNDEFYRTYMGTSIGAGAARISHLLGLTGPSIATESGCSSAMVAVHLACRSLRLRETNLALACGVNLLLHPFDETVMPMVLSPEGRCKTFDAKADGFGRGEGCGVLVLKRLSDAIRDQDNIWALLRGTGMTQEGVSKSMGTPTVQCESLAMTNALEDAKVDPALVSYVEAHGTGTVVGDPMEVAAIAKAYHSDQRKEPLLIGSVKTNVGHTESCSGITGIMKVVLSMHHEVIPPHRNFETLNPAIDLDAVPAKIPLKAVNWPRQSGVPRLAGVSSFGITGTDAHAIIEEPPVFHSKVLSSDDIDRPIHIMKISAKSDEALDILLENYKAFLNTGDIPKFQDIAYTANVGRADFSQRAILVAKSNEDAIKSIQQNKLMRGEEASDAIGKVCFLFTGQGSQYPGMAKQLYETSPVFQIHFEYCQRILQETYNIDIAQVLWSNSKSNEVSRTIYSQTSIFCVEYALLKLWESWGVKAEFALGHSLGEFAAAVCAGILSIEDAIKLVAERSLLIEQLPQGKMLVIKADKQRVDSLLNEFAGKDSTKLLNYAAVNSNEQTVVAGDSDVVLQFSECCKNNGLKSIVLEATHAFHSKHMDPILNAYRSVARSVKNLNGNGSDCNFISGMRGNVVESHEVDAEYWVAHTREKVSFLEASKRAVELGCRTFIEIGPQPILSALTMMNNDTQIMCVPSLKRNENEWETLLNTLGKLYIKGLEIDWSGFDQFHDRRKVNLPHYPFRGRKFWPDLFATSSSTVHPLVGNVLPNASSTKLFQCGLSLRNLEYVKDHAIGENVIFPGAGYLEMCLAAGLATVEGSTVTLAAPSRPMKVENLTIQAPLCLHESKTVQVQTVVELNICNEIQGDWNDLKVDIFKRMDVESSKWLPHAKATFSPLLTAEEKHVAFDTNAFTQTLEKPTNDEFIREIYAKLASVGLKFGPTFRSLDKVWRDAQQGTLLAKVKVPSGQDSKQSNYIVHPVVLDAMIQSIMMLQLTSNLKKKLYVPIKIGKFIWLSSPTTDSANLYIHAFNSNINTSSGSALLLDSKGKVLAVMSSVEFIDTTVKAMNSVLEQQTCPMPDLWEEVWKPQLGPLQHRLNLEKTKANYSELNIVPDDSKIPPPAIAKVFNEVETLVYLNILRCLHECGWKPILDHSFPEAALCHELGIHESFHQYFGFMLEVLEMENILKKETLVGDATNVIWKVVKIPLSLEETEVLLASSQFNSELNSSYSGAPLLIKVGECLSKIITGSQPALNILFPQENQGYPSVADFYTAYDQTFQLKESGVPKFVQRLRHMKKVMEMQGQKFIWRMLEVGAGTGSLTEVFLKGLEETGVEFEYTYTDVSASFFPAAEKRFEKHAKHMHFRKLNIEEDPVDQGFTPEYYDFICASEVIHATRNIRESLGHMRMLLKPNGRLDLEEMTRVNRSVTFLFGLLEGFWRFEDLELRPRHCTLSKQDWASVLESCGFEVGGVFPNLNNHHSYIWSARTSSPMENVTTTNKRKCWLIFTPEGECQISRYLKDRLGKLTSRMLISVKPGVKYEERQDEIIIRKEVENDFVALFKCLKKKHVNLEGIVYCWALENKISSTSTQEEILRPYFYLTKSLLQAGLRGTERVTGLTRGVIPVGDTDIINFSTSTLWGFTKSLQNENNVMNFKLVDVEAAPLNERQLEEVFCELWSFDKEPMLAYREGTRFYPKFQPHKPINSSLKLPPGTDRFQLVMPESRSVSDLQFGTLDTNDVKEDEVEVQIKASALNFRDVLSVIKPSEEFKNINTVGFDFAGVIHRVGEKVRKWAVGDRVWGCNIHFTSLPSHVTLNQDLLIRLEDNLSFCEGATMPAVFLTSIMCLIDVAKITKEDVVLIHTATGGVGLSAIEICKHVGCTIIATAGSKRKQNYLKSLGIQHIFHSRNTQYGDQILELTNGRGVDVVLNSLTSEGFKEATLKACGKGAKFVEMSKLNIWTNEEVRKLRRDVEYTIIDVSVLDVSEWKQYLNSVKVFLKSGVVKPIPYVRFDGLNVRDALQFMQKAKHIGKIVCTMPELGQEEGKLQVFTPMFNDTSTYLITGGLGGIGFVVCQWMVEKGAKHVLLAGRKPPNLSIQNKINELNCNGANVKTVQMDVGDFLQCKELIQTQIAQMGLPPLKGVMHAAGTLSDGLIINQDWSKLSSTFNTKVTGTLNLHELTKTLNLEYFVVFSSMASLFGPPGQCNHAAGNFFEDTLIHYRNSIGLPGTTVNWGQWGEVGIATEIDLPGLKSISNLQGLTGLEYALNTQSTQLAIINMESFLMLSKLFPHLAIYLDERVWKSNNAAASIAIKSDEFWHQYEAKLDANDKITLLKNQVKNSLRTVLKLDDNELINEDGNFQEMGVDSLMFVEIRNHLQSLLGERVTITASAFKDCNTINLCTETLVKLMEGDFKNIMIPLTMEEVNELIREDCVLPEHISSQKGQLRPQSTRDIKVVLLTGCTGTFGPYVLKELSNSPQITKIICLMRPSKTSSVEERLRNVLTTKELLSQVNMSKVVCKNGNVAQVQLGMDSETWKELSGSVDAIFNCSAKVNHTEHYRKTKSDNDVRAVNIGGMKNLLEFACTNRLKYFCQASSLLAVVSANKDDRVSEEWPVVGDYDNVTAYAYPNSKFVSDFLAGKAVERGIPCKVLRLPLISGEEETGRCDPERNHALLRYLFILKNGIMPSNPWPLPTLPVDICAQVSVRIFLDDRAKPDVYNIGNANPDIDQAFVNIAETLGYQVDLVEFSEFTKCVQEQSSGNSTFSHFKDLYADEDVIMKAFSSATVFQRWMEGIEVFKNTKVAALIPNFYESQRPSMEYMYRDLLYIKSQGWFERFGL
ncbi:unnamed protein product [Orchesella dallaii]|uniref:Fatty acid synthase n=1 Tax=Orchesella dallaii TaxID=48710 RepID=A0ABP1Q346_9HEXA